MKWLSHLVDCSQKAYLAVTDGVGGWAESGIDPSLFSESLSYYMHQHTLKNPSADPGMVLKRGYDAVIGDREVKMGSSTAVVVGLDKRRGMLQAVKSVFAFVISNSSNSLNSKES